MPHEVLYDEVRWILRVEDDPICRGEHNRYIYGVGGDWGPSHLPGTVRQALDSCSFDMEVEANRYIRDNQRGMGWKMRAVAVRVHATFEWVKR